MGNYVLTTDCSTDLTADLRERFGVDDYCHSITITYPDGHTQDAALDWDDQTPQDFYSSMSRKALLKTGFCSLAEQEAFFEKHLQAGNDILHITISSGLSGTYQNCVNAANNLMEKYPDRKIFVVDSLRYSGGTGLLTSIAGDMKKAGKSIEEVYEWCEANKKRIRQMGTVDDLIFLMHSGRVKGGAAVMGSLINIKPMADFDGTGVSLVIGKTKGYPNLLKGTIEYMKRTGEDLTNQRIFVCCTNRKSQATQLTALIQDTFHPAEIVETFVNKSNGANIGPGMLVAFYLGKEVADDLSDVKEVVADIVENL